MPDSELALELLAAWLALGKKNQNHPNCHHADKPVVVVDHLVVLADLADLGDLCSDHSYLIVLVAVIINYIAIFVKQVFYAHYIASLVIY